MPKVKVYVTLKPGILDPQGTTVAKALKSLGFQSVQDVRIGKFIELYMSDVEEDEIPRQVEEMCRKLLANLVIENYSFEIEE